MFHIFDFKMKWLYCTLDGLYKSWRCEGSCCNSNQYIYINSTFWFGGGHFAVLIIISFGFLMQELLVQWWIHCLDHLFELFPPFALISTEITTPIRLLFPDILPSKLGSSCFFPSPPTSNGIILLFLLPNQHLPSGCVTLFSYFLLFLPTVKIVYKPRNNGDDNAEQTQKECPH